MNIFLFAFLLSVDVSDFVSIVGVPMGITSSAVGLKICTLTAAIKKHKSIIKEKSTTK